MSLNLNNKSTVYAWGRQALPQEVDEDDESTVRSETCSICYTNVAYNTFVKFLPCGHQACSSCMQELRKESIRKVLFSTPVPLSLTHTCSKLVCTG